MTPMGMPVIVLMEKPQMDWVMDTKLPLCICRHSMKALGKGCLCRGGWCSHLACCHCTGTQSI